MFERVLWKRRAQLSLMLMVAFAIGCSGGGGESPSTAQGVTSVASEGPIAGFGSVIMNGVRWNTDSASFEVDGRSGSQSDLGVGMVVRVEGERFSDGTARADRVIFEPRLRGPIRRIDNLGPDSRALEIFGLRAFVSRAETRFDGTSLDSLSLDTVVDLSGFVNAEGDLEVTHLRQRGGPVVNVTEVKLFGRVAGLAGGSFILGTSEILFDNATAIDDFGPGGLRDGLEVRVEGTLLANDDIQALEIETRRRGGDDRFGETEIQGVVTDFAGLGSFRVAGQQVDASRATFEPADTALLKDGVRVEVEGPINSAGVLVAEKVKFRSNRVRIHAEVAADADVDVAGDRIWMLGIPIDLDRGTEVRDQRDDVDGFDLADVRAGDFLEIRGVARSDGRVVATRFEREDHDDLGLRGPVDMIDEGARMFTILGVPIPVGSATVFQADDGSILSESEFFGRVAPGIVVQAEDREDGDETDFDFANEVEIEEPELEDRNDDNDNDNDDDDSPGSLDD
jgi:Domain of unknown function (DUF5666)